MLSKRGIEKLSKKYNSDDLEIIKENWDFYFDMDWSEITWNNVLKNADAILEVSK